MNLFDEYMDLEGLMLATDGDEQAHLDARLKDLWGGLTPEEQDFLSSRGLG